MRKMKIQAQCVLQNYRIGTGQEWMVLVSQPVMQVVIYNPVDKVKKERQGGKKTGVTWLLTEAR